MHLVRVVIRTLFTRCYSYTASTDSSFDRQLKRASIIGFGSSKYSWYQYHMLMKIIVLSSTGNVEYTYWVIYYLIPRRSTLIRIVYMKFRVVARAKMKRPVNIIETDFEPSFIFNNSLLISGGSRSVLIESNKLYWWPLAVVHLVDEDK
jgi:hypothetical protein